MEQKLNDEQLVRRYLLGELPEEEQERVERQMLVDGDYSALVSVLEEDLIEDYVSGRLGAGDASKFERVFLTTPEGVEQVKLARNLRAYALKQAYGKSPEAFHGDSGTRLKPISLMEYLRSKTVMGRFALATAAALVVLVGWSLVAKVWQRQQRPDTIRPQLEAQLAEEQARNEELAKSLQQEQDRRARLEQELASSKNSKPEQPLSALASIVLSPGMARAGGPSNELVIKPGASQASFRLLIRKTSYGSFRASINTEDGRRVWSGPAHLSPGGGEVRLSVPVNLLPNGKYFIQLQGAAGQGEYQDIATYYFTVVKKPPG
jgi:anti-sigma-K factor RskA